jgi:type I restriction enzyme S subunit
VKGELPEGWEWKRLGDIGKIHSGSTPSTNNPEYFDGDIPWITPADLSNFDGIYIERGKKNITEKGLKSSSVQLLPKDTILFSSRAPIGYVAIAANPVTTNQGFKNLVLNKNIDPKYVFYYLKTHKREMQQHGSGTTFLEVSAARFSKIPIIIPPLENQRQIVAVFEQVELVKRQRYEADALTGALLQSVFYEMFGDPVRNEKRWETKTLYDILYEDPQNGLYKPSSEYGEDGTPIVRIDSFYDGKIGDLRELKRIKCTEKEIAKYQIHEGDVLINRVNSLDFLGKCGLVQKIYENTIYECNMIRMRPNRSLVHPTYLTAFLCTQFVKNQILNRAKKAVNQASINQQDVKALSILLPPLALQQQFANIVESVERIRQRQVESGCEIERLCEGLMARAFAGELVV